MTRALSPLSRVPLMVAMALLTAVLASPSASLAECTQLNLFEPPIAYATGPTPLFIAPGDFNEDGVVDLAVTNSDFFGGGAGGSVAILIGLGNRSYASPTYYPMVLPFGVVTGDFDEDGITDLAVASRAGHVAILRGQGTGGVGNGSFALTTSPAAGPSPYQIVAEDFDHDGILDLAVALNGTPAVSVLRGLGSGGVGNGSYAAPIEFPLAGISVGIESADFNEDGIPDLVATEYLNHSVAVLLGTGSPSLGAASFAPAAHYAAGPEPFDIAVADFNEDGHADLAVTNGSHGGTAVLLGNGGGAFGGPTFLASGNSSVAVPVDVDQDDILDLIIGSTDGAKAFLYFPGRGSGGVGNGTFGSPTIYDVGSDPFQIVAGDFDDDGQLDLFASSYLNNFIMLLPGTCTATPPDLRPPVLTDVRDVPHDQGGRVFLTWTASSLDVIGGSVIEYRVWRRVPSETALARLGTSTSSEFLSTRVSEPDGSTDLVFWEALATLPAQRLEGYGYTAATTQDSLRRSNPFTAFFVTALTSDIDVFYSSNVDSGYSVDNLPPRRPVAFTGELEASGATLSWEPSEDPDLFEYRVYRGAAEDFSLSEENLIGTSSEPHYVDAQGAGDEYYKLTAVDTHGNESDEAMLPPLATLGTREGHEVALALRGAVPNPSRGGELVIQFSLPTSKTAHLELLDLAGRRIVSRRLAGLGPGNHSIAFGSDRPLPIGIYLVRLVLGATVREAKAVVIR